ncbi:hypothetical protein Tco_0600766 [Tanacetum coccineum]
MVEVYTWDIGFSPPSYGSPSPFREHKPLHDILPFVMLVVWLFRGVSSNFLLFSAKVLILFPSSSCHLNSLLHASLAFVLMPQTCVKLGRAFHPTYLSILSDSAGNFLSLGYNASSGIVPTMVREQFQSSTSGQNFTLILHCAITYVGIPGFHPLNMGHVDPTSFCTPKVYGLKFQKSLIVHSEWVRFIPSRPVPEGMAIVVIPGCSQRDAKTD